MIPTFRGMVDYAASSGAGGALTRNWIAGHQAGWKALVVIETAAQAVPQPPSGFTQCAGSPVSVGAAGAADATMISAWERTAASAAEPAIVVGGTGSAWGDHFSFRVFFFSDVFAGANFVLLGSNTVTPAQLAVSIPGGTTPDADMLVLAICSTHFDSSTGQFKDADWVNTSLSNLTVLSNDNTASQNGGGFAVVAGGKAVAGVVDATTGNLLNPGTQARLCLALRGVAGAGTTPDSDFNCTGACALVDGGPVTAPDRRHWQVPVGTPPVSQTQIARNGGRALRFTPNNATSGLGRFCAEPDRPLRMYVYFNQLPSTDAELARFPVQAGTEPQLLFRKATNDVVARIGAQVTSAQAVVPGVWYRFEMLPRVGANPRTINFRAAVEDEASTDKGTASLAEAPSVFSQWLIGASCLTPTTADVIVSTIRAGASVAAYPFGMAWGIGIQPTGDGVHVYNASGDFKYDNLTNVPLDPEGLSWEWLTGLLSGAGSSYLAAAAVSAGEYLEWLVSGMPSVSSVKCLELVTIHRGSNTNPHKQTLRMVDGASVVDVFTDQSFHSLTPLQHSKHYLTKPSGGAWTQAAINALLHRWGSSWTAVDLDGVPEIAGLMLEVEYVPTGGGPAQNESFQQHPTHVYAAHSATVAAAGAAAGATTIPVAALTAPIASGAVLTFLPGAGKTATLTAPAAIGATSLTVAPIPVALVSGDAAALTVTYQVTLTVTDDDGLTHAVTKPVTVTA